MGRTNRWRIWGAAAALCSLVPSCGLGTAAAVSGGASDASGGVVVAPTISVFEVSQPKLTDACELTFVIDAPNPTSVSFFYQVPGLPERRVTSIPNPQTLAGGKHSVPWDFSSEVDLPEDGSYVPGVLVRAELSGTTQTFVAGANGDILGLGNDPPEVQFVDLPGELSGASSLAIWFRDVSDDEVSIRVEFESDGTWMPARPVGLPAELKTPSTWLTEVVAPEAGRQLVFTWDSAFDLPGFDASTRLRVTVVDPVEATDQYEADVRVDNNAPPAACIQGEFLLANQDRRRGLPIPFELINEEPGDEIDVVFQWRTENDTFPDLPTDAAAVRAILADEELRRQHQVCTEWRRSIGGRLRPRGPASVELPELASTAAELLAQGVEGRELQLLRPRTFPRPLSGSWKQPALRGAVAVLPEEGGRTVLVLDEPSRGTWSLLELDLETGTATAKATGTGNPSAMARERNAASVLVAYEDGGLWFLERVAGGARTLLAQGDRLLGEGPVHGIVSLGTNAALVTVDEALVRVDWGGEPVRSLRQVALLQDLPGPWGLARDPSVEEGVFLALRDAPVPGGFGSVVSVNVHTLRTTPVGPEVTGSPLFPEPTAIAVDTKGTFLAALCNVDDEPDLRVLNPALATSEAASLSRFLDGDIRGLAIGQGRQLTVVSPTEVFVAGGIEQTRVVQDYDPRTRTVTVDAPFSPPPRSEQEWSMSVSSAARSTSPAASKTFVWDTSDVLSGGIVTLRATPLDAEVGTPDQTFVTIEVAPTYAGDSALLAENECVQQHLPVDFDRDGDLDLVEWTGLTIQVRLQESPGVLSMPATLVSRESGGVLGVEIVDLDHDGYVDVLARAWNDDGTRSVLVYWFEGQVVASPPVTEVVRDGPASFWPAGVELNGDGLLDILVLRVPSGFGRQEARLEAFIQSTARTFERRSSPLLVSDQVDSSLGLGTVDIDGDGRSDAVLGWRPDQWVEDLYIAWNDGDSGYELLQVDLSAFNVRGIGTYQVIDADSDGDLDVLVQAFAQNYDPINFAAYQRAPREFETLEVSGLWRFLTDIDRDGDEDYVPSGGGSLVILEKGRAAAVSFDGVFAGSFDLDSDGLPEILIRNGCDSSLFKFSSQTDFDTFPIDVPAADFSLHAGDLDGDGDLDVVSDGVWVTKQSAPRVFEPISDAYGERGGVKQLTAGLVDLDGDLGLDLLCGRHGACTSPFCSGPGPISGPFEELFVRWQGPSGRFDAYDEVSFFPAIADPSDLAWVDYDDDGDLDILVANSQRNNIRLFRQSAPGEFNGSYVTLIPPGTLENPQRIAVGDLDDDGHPDVAATSDGQVSVVWGRRGGFVTEPTHLVVPSFLPQSVATADVDGDGLLDLVVGGSALIVFEQEQGRRFRVQEVRQSPHFNVQALDVDRDGQLDLAYANQGIHVLLQQSPGTFGKAIRVGAGYDFQITDLDGDGDPDFLTPGRVWWGGQ